MPLWQRQEIQEMLRQIIRTAAILVASSAIALPAIWPEEFFGYKRVLVEENAPGTEAIWEEFGFEEGESVRYALNGKEFEAVAWRFNDATSAMAVYEWKRPVDAQPSELTGLGVEWDDGAFVAHGNYVLRFDGYKPDTEQMVGMLLIVPMLEQSQLPTWVSFVPADGVVSGSERFVIGPESLQEFEPGVPPSVAGFHFGVEGRIARYNTPAGDLKLGVFSYPTPHIARQQLAEFRMLPGALVKRTGPLLAVILNPADADEAQKLLGRVNYRATITWDEMTRSYEPSLGEILLTTLLFVGGLLLAAVILGGLFGGMKFRRWRNQDVEEDPMILLHIEDK